MKKLFQVLLIAVIAISATSCKTNGVKPDENSHVPDDVNASSNFEAVSDLPLPEARSFPHEGFYVEGTKLLDANGDEFIMRGINHAHTWFKSNTETALNAIAETGANTVRVVLSNGVQWNKDGEESVNEIVQKCKELNLIAVLEVHDATGKNDAEALTKAADYWIEIKDALIGNEPYVILNIANEWYGSWNGKKWRDGYLEVIPKLREAGLKNTIMVDSAGWGQYPKSVFDYGKEVFDADELSNLIFSIHMYEYAGGDAQTVKDNIDNALKIGVPIVIGEFGHKHTDGEVAFETIMSYCAEVGVGYLGWSWKGNSGGVEYLDISKDWFGLELSEDWGEILVNSEFGIRETSERCSVFND